MLRATYSCFMPDAQSLSISQQGSFGQSDFVSVKGKGKGNGVKVVYSC